MTQPQYPPPGGQPANVAGQPAQPGQKPAQPAQQPAESKSPKNPYGVDEDGQPVSTADAAHGGYPTNPDGGTKQKTDALGAATGDSGTNPDGTQKKPGLGGFRSSEPPAATK